MKKAQDGNGVNSSANPQQASRGRQVHCRMCGCVMERGRDQVHYIYPSPLDLGGDLRAGAYVCARDLEGALGALRERGILVEG